MSVFQLSSNTQPSPHPSKGDEMSKKPNSSPGKKAGSKSRPSRKMKKLSKGSHFVVSSADPRVLSKRKVPDGTIVILCRPPVVPPPSLTHSSSTASGKNHSVKSATVEVARAVVVPTPSPSKKRRGEKLQFICFPTTGLGIVKACRMKKTKRDQAKDPVARAFHAVPAKTAPKNRKR